MALSDAEVLNVANLARLGLSDEEVTQLRDDLSTILEHIAVLQQVDTSAISPTAQVNNLSNVMRDDVVRPSLSHEEVLANAPQRRDGFFEVKAVLGDTEGVSA